MFDNYVLSPCYKVLPADNNSSETVATLILTNDSLLKKAVKSNDLTKAVKIANAAVQAFSNDASMDQNKKTKVKAFRLTCLHIL